MLDKNTRKMLSKIIGKKKFQVKVSQPFNKLSIEFLNDFSNCLKKYKKRIATFMG